MHLDIEKLADWHAGQACHIRHGASANKAAKNKEPVHESMHRMAAWHDDQAQMLRTLSRQITEGKQAPSLGHGHVKQRPDGFKARCGGPSFCRECKAEQGELHGR